MKVAISVLLVLFSGICHASDRVTLVYPDKTITSIAWSEEERNKNIAVRHLARSTQTSTHLIRLQGSEFPHYHDHHDLNVSILSGKSIMHFQDHEVLVVPGDVVFIPQGTLHWAENKDPSASVVFAVFSPAFNGKDRRKAVLEEKLPQRK